MITEKISIISKYEKVQDACTSLRNICIQLGIDKKIYGEVELCLTEALNNIIKHAYKGADDKDIQIEFSVSERFIEITLIDFGIERKNLNIPEIKYDPDDVNTLPEGGMGLFIINSLMDSAVYRRLGDINSFVLKKSF